MCYCNILQSLCATCTHMYTHKDLNQSVPLCGAHSAATLDTLDTDGNEQLTPELPIFVLGKECHIKAKKYLNILEKYLEIKVLWKCT